MNTNTTTKLTAKNITVKRDVNESRKPVLPIADLSGKGVFDSISSNRSKQNDQKS
jgi:hypothetical protein